MPNLVSLFYKRSIDYISLRGAHPPSHNNSNPVHARDPKYFKHLTEAQKTAVRNIKTKLIQLQSQTPTQGLETQKQKKIFYLQEVLSFIQRNHGRYFPETRRELGYLLCMSFADTGIRRHPEQILDDLSSRESGIGRELYGETETITILDQAIEAFAHTNTKPIDAPITATPEDVDGIRRNVSSQLDTIKHLLQAKHDNYIAKLSQDTEVYRRYLTSCLKTNKTPHFSNNENLLAAFRSLNPEVYLSKLLAVPKLPGVTNPDTFVLGDADGSVARMVLLAIQSGHMTLNESLLVDLVDLPYSEFQHTGDSRQYFEAFNPEFKLSENGTTEDEIFKSFQSSPENSEKIARLVREATYNEKHQQLIFLGDIVHDRFSCNKSATIELIEKLHQKGAIFIMGNHDYREQTQYKDKFFVGLNLFFGMSAVDHGIHSIENKVSTKITNHDIYIAEKKWDYFEQENFQNVYYDSKQKMFYLHNGLKKVSVEVSVGVFKEYLVTGFYPDPTDPIEIHFLEADEQIDTSQFRGKDPSVLAEFLNQPRHRLRAKEKYMVELTGFRLTDKENADVMNYLYGGDVKLVHGHTGDTNIVPDPSLGLRSAELEKLEIEENKLVVNANSVGMISYPKKQSVFDGFYRCPVAFCC